MTRPQDKGCLSIAVAGAGYVGLSLAVLLAQHHDVTVIDVVEEKVRAIQEGRSPLRDPLIEQWLATKDLRLTATVDGAAAYAGADLLIVAAPTDYDAAKDFFDTSHVEEVLNLAYRVNPSIDAVIKSTVPVGYTQSLAETRPEANLVFSPEFLREGRALEDNLYPSRIIAGYPTGLAGSERLRSGARAFVGLLASCSLKPDVPTLVMGATEAEAVKLFSNTYLALRVAYFNELDTYADVKGLDTAAIVEGVCLEPRIGSFYNNPSFGYGGYCLPKDTRQLLANYRDVPQNIIAAIVNANATRKRFVADEVERLWRREEGPVGIYRLAMKSGSDNSRASSIKDVIDHLRADGVDVVLYEPALKGRTLGDVEVVKDLDEFKDRCSVIVANRWNEDLDDVAAKVYTRDLFHRD